MSQYAFSLAVGGFALTRRLGTGGKNRIQLTTSSGASIELGEENFYVVVSQYVERVELEGLSRLDFAEDPPVRVVWCERCVKAVPQGGHDCRGPDPESYPPGL